MSDIERMTITLTREMARAVKGAVATGEYASSSEIVREALRHWRRERERQAQELDALRTDVKTGLRDVQEGRVHDFDAQRIVQKGRKRLTTPDNCE